MTKTSHICARAGRPAIAALALLALSLHLFTGELSAAGYSEIAGAALAAPGHSSLGGAYAPGDRIKVTVFEILAGKSNPREALLNGLVERSELTGEYTVQQDGTLVVPFVGSMRAAGQTQPQLEQALEGEYVRTLGAQLKVTIYLLEREPIYVTGTEIRSGVVKHVPGMIVLQALALSGSLDRVSADNLVRVDIWRERERMHESQEKAKALLARLQVLSAEQEGTQPSPSPELLRLAGNESAKARIADELRLREMERKKRAGQIDALSSVIDVTRKELTLLRERIGHSETVMKEHVEYLKTLEATRGRGALGEPAFRQARNELSNVRERWHDVQAAIAQTERKLLELEQEKTRIIIDADIERYREIKEVSTALTGGLLAQASIEALLHGLEVDLLPRPRASARAVMTIIRRGPSGLSRISADEFSALQPGDILQVGGPEPRTDGSILSSFDR